MEIAVWRDRNHEHRNQQWAFYNRSQLGDRKHEHRNQL